MKSIGLRRIVIACAMIAVLAGALGIVYAQRTPDKPLPSPYAEVLQKIGTTEVKVTFHRPGVKGREIWDTNIVPYDGDPVPWRAGANNNTVFSFSKDVKINGQALPAGEYGFHTIPTDGDWTLIFSKDAAGWGSFRYNPENDALRVTATPTEAPHQEWLIYGFENFQPPNASTSADAFLHWEKKKVSFNIEEAAASTD